VPQSVNGAFELVDQSIFQPIPVGFSVAAEGRVVVIVPPADLALGRQYEIRYAAGATLVDLNGQTVTIPEVRRIGGFTTALTPSTTPAVLTTFPLDGEQGASDLGSVVVVFDRAMDPDTVTVDSFQVTVDGESPDDMPEPEALLALLGGVPVDVNQVYTWRNASDDLPVSLGIGSQVQIDLSPDAQPIESGTEDEEALETTSFEYGLASIGTPTMVFKDPLAEPADAIGGPNLADAAAPIVTVQLASEPQSNDRLGIFVFGQSIPPEGEEAQLRSLYREIGLTEGAGSAVQLTEGDLDLIDELGAPNLAEGTIDIVVQHQRGDFVSALRRFDADLSTSEPDRPSFDITAPQLAGFGTSGTDLTSLRSDVRDLAVVGLADEETSFALVATDTQDNTGTEESLPPVAGAVSAGLFVTRPIPVGVLGAGETLPFTITAYDRAQNATAALAGVVYEQVGLVEGGGLTAGAPIAIRVFDVNTLAPLQGAQVIVQGEAAGTFTIVSNLTSGVDGTVGVMAAADGQETVLTVSLEGYDLFTFYGVPGPAMDVLLQPSNEGFAETIGLVSADLATGAGLTLSDNFVGDTRLALPGDPLLVVDVCETDASGVNCPFGPFSVGSSRLGAQSLLVSSQLGLGAFTLRYPTFPVEAGVQEQAVLELDGLLAGDEEAAITVDPAIVIEPQADSFGDVDAFEVTIEAVVAGTRGTLPIGVGAGVVTAGVYTVSGSYPGAADGVSDSAEDELGTLVQSGTFENDLLLRVEFVDENGNRAGVRPRFASSTLDAQPVPSTEVPLLRAPAADSTTAGAAYALELDDVLPDAFGQQGLYRVTLTAATGRRWVLWRQDVAGGGGADQITINVPPIAAAGAQPLPAGSIEADTAVFAWPALDLAAGRMLWSDVEREFERFGFGATVTFQQP
ncbi:MAG: hypothetical protein AB8H79_20735, partial [Myxococcota bacterium]